MVIQLTNRISLVGAFAGTILAGWLCWATAAGAESATAPPTKILDPILVTAKKRPDPVADEKLIELVEVALHTDPFFYDGHVTVRVKNGVATLSGKVFDDWDMRQAMRIGKRIAGVKRVINDLEIESGGE
jgi:hypothetical protein